MELPTIVERMSEMTDYLDGMIFDAESDEALRDKSRLSLGQQRKYVAWVNEMKHLRQSTKRLATNCIKEGVG